MHRFCNILELKKIEIELASGTLHVRVCGPDFKLAITAEKTLPWEAQVGWLVVFYVPSTARSFRDGTPIYCPLRRT